MLAALAAASLGLPASATDDTGSGGIGIQLLDAPAAGRADPRAQRYIVDHLAPGAAIQRRVRVVNNSGQPRRIDLYAGAASVDGGRFQFGDLPAGNELTPWISIDPPRLDLNPGGEATATVAIRVPADAPEGERYAVIWAATASAPDPATIRQVNRVGIRVYLDVGPGGGPATDFAIGGVVAHRDGQGRPSVTIEATNTGGRAVDLTGSGSLSDGPAGLRAGPFPVTDAPTLAPGQAGIVTIAMPPDLPAGPWTITVELRSGTVQRSITRRITFPVAGGRVESTALAAPWPKVAIPSAAALLVLAGLVMFARRQANRSAARVVAGVAARRKKPGQASC